MANILDYMERAFTGPILTEKEYYLKLLIPTIRKLVKRYEIVYNPEDIVKSDVNMEDRLFKAAVELIAEVGVYCENISRVIKFSRNEIVNHVENNPTCTLLGEGSEQRCMKPRKPGEDSLPWFLCGHGYCSKFRECGACSV